MERLRNEMKYIILVSVLISMVVVIGGCSIMNISDNKNYYETESEAKEEVIKVLEDKYHKKFELVGDGKFEMMKEIKVFETHFKDEDGLEADIKLPQQKKIGVKEAIDSGIAGESDTYSQVFYTKKAREEIEPLFKEEPFEKYFIVLEGAGHAKNDLSLSADEYFQKYGTEYSFFVILKDEQEVEYYTKIIHPFYQKLISEQKNNFGMFVYANQKEIFSVKYVNSKGFNAQKSYEEILEKVQDGLNGNQPQPDEKWLRSEYYNGDE